jgi:hypothetical protein
MNREDFEDSYLDASMDIDCGDWKRVAHYICTEYHYSPVEFVETFDDATELLERCNGLDPKEQKQLIDDYFAEYEFARRRRKRAAGC